MSDKSTVYFANCQKIHHTSLLTKLGFLLDRLDLNAKIKKEDLIAIKQTFAETGSTAMIRPMYYRTIVERCKALGGKPILMDCNTLYRGTRGNAYDHLLTASQHGYNLETVGAPVVIADGLEGMDFVEIPVTGKHFTNALIGRNILEADFIISVAHFKGHSESGFGGAIKNIGMGCGARPGKQQMHSSIRPNVVAKNCTLCRKCAGVCPVNAITFDVSANIDRDVCIGCGHCVTVCRFNAINVNWESSAAELQEKMCEYMQGITSRFAGRIVYINVLLDISPDCDCWGFSDLPIVPNIGILASEDPVAIDQASYDLVGPKVMRAILREDIKPQFLIDYAEQLGLGKKEYMLKEV